MYLLLDEFLKSYLKVTKDSTKNQIYFIHVNNLKITVSILFILQKVYKLAKMMA